MLEKGISSRGRTLPVLRIYDLFLCLHLHVHLSIDLNIHLSIHHLFKYPPITCSFYIEKKEWESRDRVTGNVQSSFLWCVAYLMLAEYFPLSGSVSKFGSAQRLYTNRAFSFLIVVLVSWLLHTLLRVNKTLICMEILKSKCTVILDFHILYLP